MTNCVDMPKNGCNTFFKQSHSSEKTIILGFAIEPLPYAPESEVVGDLGLRRYTGEILIWISAPEPAPALTETQTRMEDHLGSLVFRDVQTNKVAYMSQDLPQRAIKLGQFPYRVTFHTN